MIQLRFQLVYDDGFDLDPPTKVETGSRLFRYTYLGSF